MRKRKGNKMFIKSKAFTDGGMIPLKYTGFGEDVSPDFVITDAPEDTISFAIVMDDLDVPFRNSFTHWVIWNITRTDAIPEGLPKGAYITGPIDACQGVAWGNHCYRGPKQPVFIRNEHRYVFTLYALDCRLDISEKANKKILLEAMQGHILAESQITGRYQP